MIVAGCHIDGTITLHWEGQKDEYVGGNRVAGMCNKRSYTPTLGKFYTAGKHMGEGEAGL